MRRLACLLLAICACHKAAPAGADADALWDLAPEGTELGIVVTPHAMGMLTSALAAARTLVATPDFAPIKPQFDDLTGNVDTGLSTTQGFAVFVTKTGVVGALPIADRDKFVASKHGTRGSGDAADSINGTSCKPLHGTYMCASSDAMFARVGKASLRGKVTLAGARGDIELYAPGLDAFGGTGDLAAVAQLTPGQIELNVRWAGTPKGTFAELGSAAAPKVDPTGTSGFAALDVSPFLKDLPETPVVTGVTTTQLAKAMKGPIVATMPAGTTELQLRMPLADAAPVQALLDHCDELPLEPRGVPKDGTCRFALNVMSDLEVDAWIEKSELRIAAHKGTTPAGQPGALSAFGRQLAAGDWSVVFWGRGSMMANKDVTPMTGDIPPETAMMTHLMSLVSEVGVGAKLDGTGLRAQVLVRTVWASPQGDKLAEVSAVDVMHGGSAAAQLATPGSLFAIDFAAGQGGLMIPAALLGLGAGLIGPELLQLISPAVAPPGTDSFDPDSASPTP
ncbi:MAG: hypothetical protein JO257_11740 [Deltaproteobacteria bacterium]|nr:hypothetical protein [Deltaproteobacteria bacterium]